MPIQKKPKTVFLLRLLQLNIYNLIVDAARDFDISPIHYMVMSILNSRSGWSTADLARRFHIAPQSMNEVVATLLKKKLISRRVSPDHKRILHISLTAAGKKLLERFDRAVDRVEHESFKDFSAGELLQFRELLKRALVQFTPNDHKSNSVIGASPRSSPHTISASQSNLI
jgi:DNA-binding MarR family transcriptional regulator